MMRKQHIFSLLVAGLALLGGIGLFASGMATVAHEEGQCGPSSTGGPFMGMSDPDAPYDLRFIDEMVMHHRGAIMSAEMMIADSERPELRDLAQRIQADQQRQIDQMLTWRAKWYPDTATPAMHMEPETGGMMDMMDGEVTDRMFLRMMIPHHQLAIDMAEDALINAEHEELKMLAQEIIDGQSAEIEEMEGYLREWYDETSTRDAAADAAAFLVQRTG